MVVQKPSARSYQNSLFGLTMVELIRQGTEPIPNADTLLCCSFLAQYLLVEPLRLTFELVLDGFQCVIRPSDWLIETT